MIVAAFEGFALGAGLIIAIGAQNAYVIRQGIKNEHVFAVVLVCAFVDIVLISVGAAGIGTLIAGNEILRSGAAWGGALYLFIFGVITVRAAVNVKDGQWDKIVHDADERGRGSRRLRKAVFAAAAFSLLNPHVYLDTVILLGGVAAQYTIDKRIYFAGGAMMASVIWFCLIGYGATLLTPYFRTTMGAKVLETIVAVVMFFLSAMLVIGEMQR